VGIVDRDDGRGVAEVAAAHGFEVVLRSRSQSGAEAAIAAIAPRSPQVPRSAARATTGPDHEPDRGDHRLRRAGLDDLVLESIIEDLAMKRRVFADLDRCARTTPCWPPTLDPASGGAGHADQPPERVCGSLFNPPGHVLVEVVRR